jgi:hypothetical protein
MAGKKEEWSQLKNHKENFSYFLPFFFVFFFKRPWNVFEMEIYTNHSRLPDG